MQKINIVQFLAYFPPHKGGVEDVAMEWSSNYVSGGYGDVLNIVFSGSQDDWAFQYEKDGYMVIVMPAFDIVPNFPFPKFWKKNFWNALKIAKNFNAKIIQTHTRFFLATTLGGLCAKLWGKKWVHIEHGTGATVSDKFLVVFFSRLFDATLGRCTFLFCNRIIGISEACKRFVNEGFTKKPVDVIYRGIDFYPASHIDNIVPIQRLTFIGRLTMLKGVSILLESILHLIQKNQKNFSLSIVGDGEERAKLEKYVTDNNLGDYVRFTGFKNKEEIANEILPNTDILINPSLQEGLPTTVIEGLLAGCQVIATDVGGTGEIANSELLQLIPTKNTQALENAIIKAITTKKAEIDVREIMRNKFSWKNNIIKYYEIYKEISKLRVAFMSPFGEGGPTSLYRELVPLLNQSGEIECCHFHTFKDWIGLHFTMHKFDVLVSVVPFLFRNVNRYILNIHGNYRREGTLLSRYIAYPLNIFYADELLYPSEYLNHVLNIKHKKNYVIHNFCSTSITDAHPTFPDFDKTIELLSVTKFDFFDKARGITELVMQLSKYEGRQKIHLSIGGYGIYLTKIQADCNSIKLPDNISIEWLGKINKEQFGELLQKTHLFVYCSFLDVLPITLLEVAMSNIPFITNDFLAFTMVFPEEMIFKDINLKMEVLFSGSEDRYLSLLANTKKIAEKYEPYYLVRNWVDYIVL